MSCAALAVSDCPHLREVRLVHCFEINQPSMAVLLSATPAKLIAMSFIHTPITPRALALLTGEDTPLVCLRVIPLTHFILQTGTWAHLKKVVVSLSFSDYFEDINDRKSVLEFKKIVERLNVRADHAPSAPPHMPLPLAGTASTE